MAELVAPPGYPDQAISSEQYGVGDYVEINSDPEDIIDPESHLVKGQIVQKTDDGITIRLQYTNDKKSYFIDDISVKLQKEWNCTVCTFINNIKSVICQMCGAQKWGNNDDNDNHFGGMTMSAYNHYNAWSSSGYDDGTITSNKEITKNELDSMYFGIELDKIININGTKTKVYVQRNDLEYPIPQKYIIKNEEKKDMNDENIKKREDGKYKVSNIYNCFRITGVTKKNIIKIFVISKAEYCIVIRQNEIDCNKKSSVARPSVNKYNVDKNKKQYIYNIELYEFNDNDNTFNMVKSEVIEVGVLYKMKDAIYDENNSKIILNVCLECDNDKKLSPIKMYCIDIKNKPFLNIKDISKYFDFGAQCVFVSFLNDGDMILLVFQNGCVVTMDSMSFKVLNKINIDRFYPDFGVKNDKIPVEQQSNPYHEPVLLRYDDIKRERDFKILTVALNKKKNCIAWIESEYDIIYYLQIYSLNLITDIDGYNDYNKYLITSRLISQKRNHAQIAYDEWIREIFRGLMQQRTTQWSIEPSIKKGNTEYSVGTMAACNDKTVKLIFNPNGDKLLYCSMDEMANELLVIDRNTMTTLTVTCKGTPSGWIFKDYLIVSQIGGLQNNKNNKKFTSLDIQGFVSETSIAELLFDEIEVIDYQSFPWYLCLQIAIFAGSWREFRDITLITYNKDNNDEKFIKNILLETTPCDNVWNIDNYLVIMINNEIIFYDSKSINFKDEDTLIIYTNNHGIIARNNKKNMKTFQKIWIDQASLGNKYVTATNSAWF